MLIHSNKGTEARQEERSPTVPNEAKFVFRLVMLVLILCSSCTGLRKNPVSNAPISVTATLDRETNGRDYLCFRLRNAGGMPIEYYRTRLPWGEVMSACIIAVDTGGSHRTLDETPRPHKEFGAVDVLSPNQMLEGKVCLNYRFSDYDATIRKRDVIVFWSYKMWPYRGSDSNWCGGWLLVPHRN